jgi:hypothetical protein
VVAPSGEKVRSVVEKERCEAEVEGGDILGLALLIGVNRSKLISKPREVVLRRVQPLTLGTADSREQVMRARPHMLAVSPEGRIAAIAIDARDQFPPRTRHVLGRSRPSHRCPDRTSHSLRRVVPASRSDEDEPRGHDPMSHHSPGSANPGARAVRGLTE